MTANPGFNPNALRIGQQVCIPAEQQCPPGSSIYVVQPGDTFWLIAERIGVPLQELIDLNPGINPGNLYPGLEICIPTEEICPPGSTTYEIRQGDTFWSISQRLGVPLQGIIDLNPGINPNNLFPGVVICIPARPSPSAFLCIIPLLGTTTGEPAGGSVWVRQTEFMAIDYTVLFAATFLPEPDTLGDFNSYIGRVSIPQQSPEPPMVYSVLLNRATSPDQEVTWSGARIIPDRPINSSFADVRPFNTETDTTGTVILRNNFSSCN
jgi:LysM repeat protein